jgi:RHS repeat-associated protein
MRLATVAGWFVFFIFWMDVSMAKAQRVNQWIGKTAIVSIVIALCAASAHAIWPGAESIKIAPLTLVLESSGLKGDALVSETQAARQLFDRSTTTAYAPQATREIIATLEGKNTIHAIKIFGAAPYRLSVDADQSGAWSSLAGLQNIDLSHLSHDWNSILLATATQTGRLRFTLTPIASSIVTSEKHDEKDDHERSDREKTNGLPELEIWGEGTRFNLKSAAALRDSLDSKGEVPAQGRQYLATPEQGVIGAPDKMTDDLTDNTFTVKLPRNPADYKRIYLAYEVNGIAHWVHALRQINGNAAQGGFGLPISESWTAQLEEINPAWLKQGDNAITFAPPKGETGSFTVRNVRLLGELDNGSNFIMHASGNATETDTEAQSVLDGDNSTGWKPYGASSDDGTPKLTLVFDKPTQVSDLKFFLSNQLKGRFQIEYLKDEKHWMSPAREAIEGKNLTAGWNMIDAPSGGIVNGMRLVFTGGAGSSADIRELVVSGSGAGDTWPDAINVSYPDAGQYFGRVAYLRGYLQPVANNSGAAELTVAGKRVAQTDGAFGVTISKDDIGLKKQGDRSAWSVNVKATYPDGKTVSRTIKLNNYADAIDPKDTQLPSTYKKVAKPGQHEKLEFDGAGIELSGTEIGKDITLGIRALSARELALVNAGMTNVTKAGQGYRFTPTPMKFNSQLKVSIPYDPALLPRGKTEKDIKTFYFDIAANRWRELQRFAIDKTQHKIISLSDHFTDMINATVTVPEHPDAVSFNPNSIKDIKAADPGAGINLIEPPKPNNTGDARLSYPIEIPPGRQGLQPNLSVNYSSGGGNGWMGLGWDLTVPSISIDTRWGVPRYSTENETETYLLNGEMLTPVAHRGILKKRTEDLGSWKGETVKFFHTRVEGAFSKIIRHGTAPANYWWEVIDKNGVKNLYGGVDQNDASGKLGSSAGVFKWSLRQSRDTHDNTVNYTYARVCDTGTGTGNNANGGETCSGGVPGHQLYLSQIGYTGRLGDPTVPYTIDFVRASQLPNQARRLDVIIDARGGFKQVTADRLSRIDVKFNGSLVRRYEVNYQTGAFDKTLLANVVQRGSDDSEFYRHTFAYFDEIRKPDGNYWGFGSPQLVKTGDDNLAFNSMGGALAHTVLGGAEGRTVGFDGYAGVGVISGTKMINVGIAPSISQSESTGSNAFIDVDGDGLPDKVFLSGNGPRYRKNTTSLNTPDQLSFASGGSPQAIAHFPPPSATQSETFSLGVQGFLYGLALNASRGKTRTRDMSYLSDINGDGLVDIVDRGNVLFNTARNTGVADFQNNSYLTEVPLGNVGGAVDVNQLPGVTPAEKDKFEADHPLMDNVRRWVAPFDGEVRITGAVKLVDFSAAPPIGASVKDAEREFAKKLAIDKRNAYKQADGVIVSIQKNGEHPRWERRIEETDYDEHQPDNVDAVPVKKGDRLYFRLQSVYDGAYDLVKWSPTIEYVKNGTELSFIDAHGRNAYRFQAAEDFILANRALELAVPYRGTIRLAGLLNKTAATNDDVLLRVTVTDHTYSSTGDVTNSAPRTVVAKKIAWDYIGPLMLDDEFPVGKDSGIKVDFVAESPVDFAVFKWGDPSSMSHPQPGMPEFYYTEAWQEELQPLAPANSTTSSTLPGNADSMMPTGTDGMQPILDANGNPIVQHEQKLNVYDDNGQLRFKMPVKYNMEIYSQDHLVSPQKPWVAPRDGNILWTPWIKLKTYSSTNPDTGITTHETRAPNGSVEITAKRRSELLVNQVVQIKGANRRDRQKEKDLNGKVDETTQGYAAVQVMRVKAGDEIFFDTSTRDPDIERELESAVGYIHYASDTPWQVPLSDAVAFNSHILGSVPLPNDNSGDGAPPVYTPPLDGRGMLVVRNGSNVVVYKQIIDFEKTPLADIVYDLKLNAGEKLYFDVFTKEPKVNIFRNQSWANYTAVSSWVAPFAGDISITPVLNFGKGAPDGSVILNVIRSGVVIGQQSYNVSSGKVAGSAITMTVAADQQLEFAYSTTNYPLSSYLKDKGSVEIDYQKAVVPANLDNWTPQIVGSRRFTIDMPGLTALQNESVTVNHFPETDSLFGNSFRGWSTAAYNGSGPLAASPIKEYLLVISTDANEYKNPDKHRTAWPAYPVVEEDRWGNQDDLWWTSPVEMSASRKGLDNLYDPKLENYTQSRRSGVAGAARPPRMSHGDIQTMGAGFVLSRTQSDITMTSDLELMDMNGDRFPDVVSQGGIQYTWADGNFFDSGAGIGAARGTVEASTTIGLGPGGPGCTCTAGANKPDNSGDKLLAELSSIPIAMSGTTGTNNVDHDLIDINGDGLPDRVRVSGNAIKVQLNTGYVFAGEETWSNGAPVALPSSPVNGGNSSNTSLSASFSMWNAASGGGVSVSKGHNYAKTTLMDINGDGLNDIVESQGANLSVWLNTGAGFATAETWPGAIDSEGLSDGGSSSASMSAKFGFSFDVLLVNFSFSFAGNAGQTASQPTTSYIDVNGDGYVDGVNSVKDSEMNVAINPIGRTNLLRTVARPLGATIELEYKRDGNTYDMPQSRWVLSKTKVTDGVRGDGVDTLSTAYQYENGKYDRFERDFFGYAKVTEQQLIPGTTLESVYRSTVSEYLNGNFYTKGLLWRERQRKGDNDNEKYTETQNTYLLHKHMPGSSPDATGNLVPLSEPVGAEGLIDATIFPQLVQTERRFYEGAMSAGKITLSTYRYDNLGNVILFTDYGDAGDADNVVADIGYSHCDSTYVVGKPLSITVTGNGRVMRQREADIECTTGDITQVRQLLETAQAAVTDIGYYGNGNLRSVTGPANARNQRHQVEYDYDPIVHTHITGIHNKSYNLNSVAVYNYKYGKVEATTDTNGNVTRMEYDRYGRTYEVYGPYEQGTGTPTIRFDYHPEADASVGLVPYAVSFHLDKDANGQPKPSGTIDTILFTDGLKRVLQTKKDATIHISPMGGTQDVMTVSGRVIFDALGRTEKQYYPVTEAKGSNYALNATLGDGIAPTQTFYDALDRTVRTELPDGTSTKMAYGFGSDRNGINQFMTTVWDANDHKKESYRDVNDLITTVREYNGGQTIQTSYVYDPLKQITKVIDDRGNETHVYYDNLGRRTVIDNADTGRTETVYDTAGNVIRKITANLKGQGKSVLYDYDYNRLTGISYPTFPANNVSYTYGATGDAWNRAGRISTVVHAAGVEARYYGKLGETVKENFCRKSSHCSKPADADKPGAQPDSSAIATALHAGTEDLHDIEHDNEHAPLYVTQYVYDTFGRLQRLTYPDGEVLTYGYDAGGLVNKATGVKGSFSYPYLKRLDYDKFDQRVYLQLGNGITTSYTYRLDNRRLDALQAQLPNVTHYRFQNLAYRYDNVGNILGIANNIIYPEGQKGIGEEVGGPVTQSYVYDDLYRLKEANGEYRHNANDLRRYRMSMDYDSIHNILAKEQLDEEIEKEDGKTETEVEHETSYTYGYHYAAPQTGSNAGSIHPHAPSEIGHYSFQYDANGNQLERRYRDEDNTRQIVWDEDNRMACVHEFEHEYPSQVIAQIPVNCSSTAEKQNHDDRNIQNGSHTPEVRFVYNDRGERVFKESDDNVSFYLNPHYTEKSDDAFKHILIGTTRLVTKEMNSEKTRELEHEQYYYHPDHLGSSAFVTDHEGKLKEHLEYFPFGETWIQEENSLEIAFKFTAKELDSETGLYYFGARYYDPRTSVWQSADPILAKYLNGKGNGGVYSSMNMNLYSYSYQNPLNVLDPDGREGLVLIGQPGDHGNKDHFLINGLHRAEQMAKQSHGEQTTMLVYKGNNGESSFRDDQIAKLRSDASKSGINVQTVGSANDVINYVNNKNGGNSRSEDPISNFAYVGHATPGDLDIGYIEHADRNMPSSLVNALISEDLDVGKFSVSAFTTSSNANLVGGCNTAVSGTLGRSAADKMADKVGGTVKGSSVTVYYPGGVVSDKQLVQRYHGQIVEIKGRNHGE